MAEQLLAFKAGRAYRRDGTNFVDPSPTKGAIILASGDDGLLHFMWKNRTTDEIEEDLILFPTDATFAKVSQSSGRTYVLKFSSSDQRHFFWMQDQSPSRDAEFVDNLNRLLQDPDAPRVWNANSAPQPQASTSAQQPSPAGQTGALTNQATPEQLAHIQSLIASMSGAASHNAPPELSLSDILTPSNLTPLFAAHPELVPALFPQLPPDLPTPPSPETLQRIINSPQFRAAVQNFDLALRTGLLGGLVRGLGLPDEAGTGVEPFLRAIQEQARSESEGREDNMETD